jgi:rhodanese-related sulfurtransferase
MRALFRPAKAALLTRMDNLHLLEYINHHPWLAGGAVLAIALVIVYELRARSESFATVSPQETVRLLNQGAYVIDLRPAEAYATGHVAGAKQMTGDQILKANETLKKQKEKVVVVYDDTGSLGASAVRQLAAQGFTKAFSLRGGIAAWRAENLPLSKA